MLLHGIGGPVDEAEALRLFTCVLYHYSQVPLLLTKAASTGGSIFHSFLEVFGYARMLLHGIGGSVDKAAALRLLTHIL